jgi:hypothetical protein
VRARAIAIIAVLSLLGARDAGAVALQPLELRVDGGEESWHAKRGFVLRWSNPPLPVAAIHYRVLYPSGGVAVGEARIGWAATSQHLSVPSIPGAYTAEVWLEDGAGTEGPPATAKLRFDNVAPGTVEPTSVSGWIGRTEFPYALQLGHPAGPSPLSGIRGYAVSIDRDPDGSPCPTAGECGTAETELHGGPADSLTIAELPEGANYVHAVAVSGSGTRSALAATTVLRVDKTDPVTRLSGDRAGWSNRPLTLTASATDAASGMTPGGGGSPFTAIRVDGGTPTGAAGDTASTTVIASGIHTVAHFARDAAGNTADGGSSNGLANRAPATTTVKIDREAPRLAFASAQDPRDPERIEATASDSLSGLDPTRGSISVRQARSGERFTALPTELRGAVLRARWDSEAYPPGDYEFRATVHDLAGNSASTLSRDNGSAMRLSSPLKVRTTLLSDFGSRTVPYGQGASFSGRLIAGRRAALSGMPVRVIERFDAGAAPRERESTVVTGAGGAFSVRLEPGPSRRIVAVAPPTATLRGAGSKPARLAVRGGVRIGVSSTVAKVGGRPIVFRGKVAGSIPADGKIVQLQFRLAGLPWSEFRTIRSDPRGGFRYAYRFADDDSRGVCFQFRAFAPAQAGWPFEPAGSAPVAVRGR